MRKVAAVHLSVNTRIELHVMEGPDRGRYLTRVEDLRHGEVILALPTARGLPLSLHPGAQVACFWTASGGSLSFEAWVIRVETAALVPWIAVNEPREVSRMQRREYVRLAHSVPVRFSILWAPEGFAYSPSVQMQSRTRDISGGGIMLAAPVNLPPGTHLDLILSLGEQSLHALGDVVRVFASDEEAGAAVHWTGVRFMGLEERERDAIVRYVFAQQRLLRRKGLT